VGEFKLSGVGIEHPAAATVAAIRQSKTEKYSVFHRFSG
jgi:hypothetical protein